ncbi:MAG TPA: hypothetical protein VD969_18415 [Symbiobacteriaceae bacterium]|nr:hypothetical protein [Symbiobacteriaceae bacterium]
MLVTKWLKVVLAVLVVLAAGCSGAPTPAPAPPAVPAPPPASDDAERLRKYDELRNSVAGIPYLVLIDFDERIDKLVIGVGTLEAKQAVQREIARVGLPEESVVIEHPKQLLSEAAPFAGCQAAMARTFSFPP